PQPPRSTLFPYTTLFRSDDITMNDIERCLSSCVFCNSNYDIHNNRSFIQAGSSILFGAAIRLGKIVKTDYPKLNEDYITSEIIIDRKSTRLNSSHVKISY